MAVFDFNQNIVLENDRVLLRPLVAEDIDVLRPVAFQDETLLQYSPSGVYNEKLLSNYIKNALSGKANLHHYSFVIFDKKMQEYAGSTSFGYISTVDLRLEIGWTWIGRAFQGTGLNHACKRLLLTYAFEVLDFERVELRADRRNTVSRRAIEKIGGQQEGLLRSHTVMSDGYRRDTVFYGLLKSEWAETKAKYFAE